MAANVLEILVQAKGGDQAAQSFDRLGQGAGRLQTQFRGVNAAMGQLGGTARTAETSMARLMQARTLKINAGDLDSLRAKVVELEKRVAALQGKLAGGAAKPGGGFDTSRLSGLVSASSFTGLATGIAAAAGAGLLLGLAMERAVAGFKKFVDEAAGAQQATTKLSIALGSTGQFSAAAVSHVQDLAGELQELTTFSDDAAIGASALIAQIGRLSGGDLDRATKAAADLAAALGIDLQSAAMLVAKAAAGSTTMLGRYGIVLDEGIPKAEKFAAALAQIESKFGGTATLAANTYTGALAQLKNAIGEVAEAAGGGFLQSMEESMRRLADRAFALAKTIRGDLDPALASVAGQIEHVTAAFELGAEEAARAFQEFKGSDAIKSIKILVEKGSLVDAQAAIAALDKGLADLTAASGTIYFNKVRDNFHDMLQKMRTDAAAGIELRITSTAEQVERSLGALKTAFQSESLTLAAKVIVDTAEIEDAIREATTAADPERLVMAIDEPALDAAVTGARAHVESLLDLKARIELQVPTASMDRLQKLADEVRSHLEAVTVLPVGEDRTRALSEALDIAREFNKLADVRLKVAVDESSIAALAQLRAGLDAAARRPDQKIEIVSEEDLRKSATLNEELGRTRTAFAALLSVVDKGDVAATAFNGLLAVLEKLKVDLPERAAQLQAFENTLRGEFEAKINIKLDQEKARADVDKLKTALAGLANITPDKVQAFDLSQLVAGAKSAEQAMAGLRDMIDRALTAADPELLLGTLTTIAGAIEKMRTLSGGIPLIAELEGDAEAARARLETLKPLLDALPVKKDFQLRVELRDFPMAHVALARLKALVEQFPTNLELKVEVKKFEEGLKAAEKSASAFDAAFADVGVNIQNALIGSLGQAFTDAIFQAKTFAEAMEDVFKSMVDAIIQQLVRLAVLKIVGMLFGVPIPIGLPAGPSKPSATTPPPPVATGKPSVPALPPPPALVMQPVVESRPLVLPPQLVRVAFDLRALDLGKIEIEPPIIVPPAPVEVSLAFAVPPMAPLVLDAPKILMPELAPLVARLRVSAVAPLTLGAPVVGFRPAAPVVLGAPITTVGSPGRQDLSAPAVRVGDLKPVDLVATVAAPGPQVLDAPRVLLSGMPSELQVAAPQLKVELRAPEVAELPAARIETRELVLAPAVRLEEPAAMVLRPAVQLTPPPALAFVPSVALVQPPTLALSPTVTLAAPPTLTFAPSVAISPPAEQRLGAPAVIFATPAPAVLSALATFRAPPLAEIALPAPVLRIGTPEAPEFRAPILGPLSFAAPPASVRPMQPVVLAAPPVAFKPLAERLVPAPPLSVGGFQSLDIAPPRVSVDTFGELVMPAPEVVVPQVPPVEVGLSLALPDLAPLVLDAPRVVVPPLAPVTPQLRVLAPPAATVQEPPVQFQPLRSVAFAAPAVSIERIAAQRLAPPPVSVGELKPLAPVFTVLAPPVERVSPPRFTVVGTAEEIRVPAPRVRVAVPSPELVAPPAARPVTLRASVEPAVSAAKLQPLVFQAPAVTTRPLSDLTLAPPSLAVGKLPRVEIPAPLLSAPPHGRLAFAAPEVTVGAIGRQTLAAPAVRVAALAPVVAQLPTVRSVLRAAAPEVRVARLSALTLQAPAVAAKPLPPVGLGPPDVAVGGLPQIRLPAPRFSVEPLADLAFPQPTILPPDAAVVAVQLRLGDLAPIEVPAPEVSVGKVPRETVTVPPPRRIVPPAATVGPVGRPTVSAPVVAPRVIAPPTQRPATPAPFPMGPLLAALARVAGALVESTRAILARGTSAAKIAAPTPPFAPIRPLASGAGGGGLLRQEVTPPRRALPAVAAAATIVPIARRVPSTTAAALSIPERRLLAPGQALAAVIPLQRRPVQATTPAPIEVRRASGQALELLAFSRRAAEFTRGVIRVPQVPLDTQLREQASDRARRFFRIEGPAPTKIEANITALDSADFERYMRSGRGSKAMAALARGRR